jgi:hypothetical protein
MKQTTELAEFTGVSAESDFAARKENTRHR